MTMYILRLKMRWVVSGEWWVETATLHEPSLPPAGGANWMTIGILQRPGLPAGRQGLLHTNKKMKRINNKRDFCKGSHTSFINWRSIPGTSSYHDDNLFQNWKAYCLLTGDWRYRGWRSSSCRQPRELWACGVTYLRSKVGSRKHQTYPVAAWFLCKSVWSGTTGGFLNLLHIVLRDIRQGPPYGKIRHGDVPETWVDAGRYRSSGKVVGYTVGTDHEQPQYRRRNPLYLPQAKTLWRLCGH